MRVKPGRKEAALVFFDLDNWRLRSDTDRFDDLSVIQFATRASAEQYARECGFTKIRVSGAHHPGANRGGEK